MSIPNLLVGLDLAVSSVTSCPILLETALEFMKTLKADFCIVPLGSRVLDPSDPSERVASCSPSAFHPLLEDCSRQSLSLLQQPKNWVTWVCGKVSHSSWSPATAASIEDEMRIGSFLQLPSIVLPPLPDDLLLPTASEHEDVLRAGLGADGPGEGCRLHPLGFIAKIIVRHCHTSSTSKLWIPTPLQQRASAAASRWRLFFELQQLCRELSTRHRLPGFHPHGTANPRCNGMLFPLLQIDPPRPGDASFDFQSAMCWLGEDVPAFSLSPAAVGECCCHEDHHDGKNADDPHTCAKTFADANLQQFVTSLLQRRAALILPLAEPCSHEIEEVIQTGRTVVEIHSKWMDNPHTVSSAKWEDTLQVPMQPLADDLQNGVYEAFETDPVKYKSYGEAIRRRIAWLLRNTSQSHAAIARRTDGGGKLPVYLTVLGAGRGPLVTEALMAAESFIGAVELHVTAIEKNPPAAQMLHMMKRVDPLWSSAKVNILCTDGRKIGEGALPHGGLCDILVSELLGSFADNELSPECIDGFFASLRAVWSKAGTSFNPHLLSIPQSYTSLIVPVHAQRANTNVAELSRSRPPLAGAADSPVFHSPFVVKLTRCVSLTAEHADSGTNLGYVKVNAKKCFSFRHDICATEEEQRERLQQKAHIKFIAAHDGVVTGLAGYFEALLLHDETEEVGDKRNRSESGAIAISTSPDTHTVDLISWYPLYFALPAESQIVVQRGDAIEVEMIRRSDGGFVWNEWRVGLAGSPMPPLRNSGGTSLSVGL